MGCGHSTPDTIRTQAQAAAWFSDPSRRSILDPKDAQWGATPDPTAKKEDDPSTPGLIEIHDEDPHLARTAVVLSRLPGMDAVALSTLACPNLTSIVLKDEAVTGDPGQGDRIEAPMKECARHASRLTSVAFEHCVNLRPHPVVDFFRGLPLPPKLTRVTFDSVPNADDSMLAAIASTLACAKSVTIVRCHRVTAAGVSSVLESTSMLEELRTPNLILTTGFFRTLMLARTAQHTLRTVDLAAARFDGKDTEAAASEWVAAFAPQLQSLVVAPGSAMHKATVNAIEGTQAACFLKVQAE